MLIAAQRLAVLSLAPVFAVERNHLASEFLVQAPVERARVIRLLAGQPFGQFVEEAAGQRFVDRPISIRAARRCPR